MTNNQLLRLEALRIASEGLFDKGVIIDKAEALYDFLRGDDYEVVDESSMSFEQLLEMYRHQHEDSKTFIFQDEVYDTITGEPYDFCHSVPATGVEDDCQPEEKESFDFLGEFLKIVSDTLNPDNLSFGDAFSYWRNKLGAGREFTWRGNQYQTNIKGE